MAIDMIFDFLAKAFDNVPVLNKFKGYRTALGVLLYAVAHGLDAANIHGGGWVAMATGPLAVFTGLSLNAKGRS